MQLTRDRNTKAKPGDYLHVPVETGVQIFAGAHVSLNANGYAIPSAAQAGLVAVGRAEENVDNRLGAAGAQRVMVLRGVFKYSNDVNDPVGKQHVLRDGYMLDDQTVCATDGAGTRSSKVKIVEVEDDGVWIES